MRRSLAPFSGSDLSIHTRSWADFIITTFAFRFLVHTGPKDDLGPDQAFERFKIGQAREPSFKGTHAE